LAEASCFLRTCHLNGRNIHRSKHGLRCVELEGANKCWSFLRLAGYYRRFIKGFSKISKPMTELVEKDKRFEWTAACEASFHELKKRLMTTPILVMPDTEKPFSIYCDASGQRLGYVLMQDGRVVAYASK
jgi:hypothetical protein